jgi:hypothetical protein
MSKQDQVSVTRAANACVLTAIVAANHWDLRALRDYPHKADTPVFVSAARMVRQARAIGYRLVEHLRWDETRGLTPTLSVEAKALARPGLDVVWLTPGQRWEAR